MRGETYRWSHLSPTAPQPGGLTERTTCSEAAERIMAVLPEIASEAGFRPSGIEGDPAEIESATADCHESGASRNEITPGVKHR